VLGADSSTHPKCTLSLVRVYASSLASWLDKFWGVLHPYPEARFDATHPKVGACAVVPPARISTGSDDRPYYRRPGLSRQTDEPKAEDKQAKRATSQQKSKKLC
jgi:hypothetical protein